MLSLLLILYRLPVLLWVLNVLMTFGTVLGSALRLLYVVSSHFYVCMLLYCRIGYFCRTCFFTELLYMIL